LGVGAKVKIKTNAGWQTREINTQSGGGYSAQNGTLAHFGIGTAQIADSLLVLWPEGDTTKLAALDANQFVIISRDKPPVVVHRSPASSLHIVSNDSACAGTAVTLQAIGGRGGYSWSLKEDEATIIGTGAALQWPIAANTTTFVLQDGCGEKTEKEINVLDECHGSCILEPLTILPSHEIAVCEGTYVALIGQGGKGIYKWYSTQHPNDILYVGNPYWWLVEESDTIKVIDECLSEDVAVIIMKDDCDASCTLITGDLSIQKSKTLIMPGESVDLQVVNENGIVSWYLLPAQDPFATGTQLSLTLTGPVDVVAIDQCGRTDTIRLETLFIPNVITPNNDNLNEVFEIKGVEEPLHLTIVNRWGKNVYERMDYHNSWDGDNLPAGVYYYRITLGNRLSYTGSVSILR
jgi:gliding motility-associated-like protein